MCDRVASCAVTGLMDSHIPPCVTFSRQLKLQVIEPPPRVGERFQYRSHRLSLIHLPTLPELKLMGLLLVQIDCERSTSVHRKKPVG